MSRHDVWDVLTNRGFKQGNFWYVYSRDKLIAHVGGPTEDNLMVCFSILREPGIISPNINNKEDLIKFLDEQEVV